MPIRGLSGSFVNVPIGKSTSHPRIDGAGPQSGQVRSRFRPRALLGEVACVLSLILRDVAVLPRVIHVQKTIPQLLVPALAVRLQGPESVVVVNIYYMHRVRLRKQLVPADDEQ